MNQGDDQKIVQFQAPPRTLEKRNNKRKINHGRVDLHTAISSLEQWGSDPQHFSSREDQEQFFRHIAKVKKETTAYNAAVDTAISARTESIQRCNPPKT